MSTKFKQNLNVAGNIYLSGNVVADGNVTLGDADTDSITLNADITSSIIPDATDTYDLGTTAKKWRNLDLSQDANIGADINIAGAINSTAAGTPTIASSTDIKLQAGTGAEDRVEISQAPLKLANLTTTERDTKTSQNGDMIYNSTTNQYEVYENGTWRSLGTDQDVADQVAALVDSAPTTLDTLNELAAALGDDPNFATTVTNNIATKWTQDNTKISNWDTSYTYSQIGHVPLAGGTMTGLLTLSGNPTTNLQAATKQYVDTQLAGAGGGGTSIETRQVISGSTTYTALVAGTYKILAIGNGGSLGGGSGGVAYSSVSLTAGQTITVSNSSGTFTVTSSVSGFTTMVANAGTNGAGGSGGTSSGGNILNLTGATGLAGLDAPDTYGITLWLIQNIGVGNTGRGTNGSSTRAGSVYIFGSIGE